ncbi:MAG: type II toxin-antitoxin system RelE/ParE family toxin [Candidatus Bathyarchaeota archaeon]|nr:type II toxin-antitoxin system RelE/ParE family toxin [Candidatus Bathyarchaeota archaeon]
MKKRYQLRVAPTFSRGLKKLDKNTQIQILTHALALKTDPFIGKPLRGDWKGIYSLRIGTYRILYTTKKTEIHLLYVGHRKNIYH